MEIIINNNIASVNKKVIQLSPIYLELKKEKNHSPYNFMNIVKK